MFLKDSGFYSTFVLFNSGDFVSTICSLLGLASNRINRIMFVFSRCLEQIQLV